MEQNCLIGRFFLSGGLPTTLPEYLWWCACVFGAFLLGGVLFCKRIPFFFLGTDICGLSRDHNPGAANVFAHCGVKMGLFCLFLDMGKGFLPVWLATRVMGETSCWYAAMMMAPVLGHAVAPFDHFRGGKCIATAFGVMLAVFPGHPVCFLTLVGLYIVFSTVIRIRPNRRRSMVTFLLFGVVTGLVLAREHAYPTALGCVMIALIAIDRHLHDKSGEVRPETDVSEAVPVAADGPDAPEEASPHEK